MMSYNPDEYVDANECRSIEFSLDELKAIESLIPKLKKATDNKKVLLIGLSVLMKAQNHLIITKDKATSALNEQFDLWN